MVHASDCLPGKTRLLIVDHDSDLRLTLCEYMETRPFHVTSSRKDRRDVKQIDCHLAATSKTLTPKPFLTGTLPQGLSTMWLPPRFEQSIVRQIGRTSLAPILLLALSKSISYGQFCLVADQRHGSCTMARHDERSSAASTSTRYQSTEEPPAEFRERITGFGKVIWRAQSHV